VIGTAAVEVGDAGWDKGANVEDAAAAAVVANRSRKGSKFPPIAVSKMYAERLKTKDWATKRK